MDVAGRENLPSRGCMVASGGGWGTELDKRHKEVGT